MNKVIITEEMVFRQRLCEYAKKKGVIKAARKYQTNRMFVYRQLKKWDGTVKSLSLRSRRPKTLPNNIVDTWFTTADGVPASIIWLNV